MLSSIPLEKNTRFYTFKECVPVNPEDDPALNTGFPLAKEGGRGGIKSRAQNKPFTQGP
jgi:hypothetical protein